MSHEILVGFVLPSVHQEGTGKGLDIKGKSAKQGEYSGFVPFLQIHDNAHKGQVSGLRDDNSVRVFYPNRSSRDAAATRFIAMGASHQTLENTARAWRKGGRGESFASDTSFGDSMRGGGSEGPRCMPAAGVVTSTKSLDRSLSRTALKKESLYVKGSLRNLMPNVTVYDIDDYAESSEVYGLDIPEKLFWKGYVTPNNIQREEKYATGRPSMPAFQQMNIDTLREGDASGGEDSCRPVLWHAGCGRRGEDAPAHCDPMCPIG